MSGPPAPPKKKRWRPRRDRGRTIAWALCVLFAVVGVVPLSLGILVRTAKVRAWAARETSTILARELGLSARYQVEVRPWPLAVSLVGLTIDSTDGGGPFLEAERVSVRPRLFSLLAGEVDAGDVEIVAPAVRAVVAGGELVNLKLTPPKSDGSPGTAKTRPPIASVSVTDARIDASIDGVRVSTREMDVDVTTEEGGVFEASLRAGRTEVTRTYPFVGREDQEDSVDEDVVCRLDARMRLDDAGILVRRLDVRGSADFDPDPGTRPSCELAAGDWRAVELRLGAVRVVMRDAGPPAISGRVRLRAPLGIAHRFAPVPHVSGALAFEGDVEVAGDTTLPRVSARVHAELPGVDGKVFGEQIDVTVSIANDVVRVAQLEARWADGRVRVGEGKIEPLAPGSPMSIGRVDLDGLRLAGLLRDLGVHPQAHVDLHMREARLDHFRGTLSPLSLEGPLHVEVEEFGIYDRPSKHADKRRLIGVHQGIVRGNFQVKPAGVVFSAFHVDTAHSHLAANVAVGYASTIDITVAEGSKLDLADISPITTIPVSGRSTISAGLHGDFDRPVLEGKIAIDDFVFGGFPVGTIEAADARFVPLVLELSSVRLRKNQSRALAPRARIDFESADVMIDADVDTTAAPHMQIVDLMNTFHFDKDPRFSDITGVIAGKAKVHYSLGGREDRCGGGFLDIRSSSSLVDVSMFGERYDGGHAQIDFRWDDQAAGDAGMEIGIHALELRKGSGSILASGTVSHGGVVRVGAIATGVPVGRLDALGPAGRLFDGAVSMVAHVHGTLARLEMTSDISISRLRAGAQTLPASRVTVVLEPQPDAPRVLGRTKCGNVIGPAFDRAEYDRDLPAGAFRADGELLGGQIVLDDLRLTRQRSKVLTGRVEAKDLDLGKLSGALPAGALGETAPTGALGATVEIARLPLDDLGRADLRLKLSKLDVSLRGHSVRLVETGETITLAGDSLNVPELRLDARSASGVAGRLGVSGSVRSVTRAPDLDVSLNVEPIDLSKLAGEIPEVARAAGTVDASLRVTGPPRSPALSGRLGVRKGELSLKGSRLSLDGIEIDVDVGGGEIRLSRARANLGTGTIAITGRMPVRGLDLGTAQTNILLRGVKLPVASGVDLTTDADLTLTWRPGDKTALPDLGGTARLLSFNYTRPISMSANLGQLPGRAQRPRVETYDPQGDFIRFHVNVVSPRPLRFSNELVDMQLEVVDPGLALSGTNQRFGARGMLRILPESKLTLRSSEFTVREGRIRFDDPGRIAPRVDLRARTEYRRYAATAAEPAAEGAAPATGGAAIASTSGQWKIDLHAHGDAEDLRVDLTSDPPLGEEDILLLLTLGMTRAEIDRGLASSLGETVGLEALTSLTGADKAVKTAVPLIDEFRFGTGYSSRSGRTEPTVTVGKKITRDVRATVTSGISESREVRSSIEWRLGRRVSVQGSYDNVNDANSSGLGNLGADLRWRLEFE